MWLGSFVIFQGSGPIPKNTIFCDILEGVLWPLPPFGSMAWMQSEDGHCYVLLDLVQTVCIKNNFGKFSLEHHQWINIRPDAVHMQIKPDLFMSGLI